MPHSRSRRRPRVRSFTFYRLFRAITLEAALVVVAGRPEDFAPGSVRRRSLSYRLTDDLHAMVRAKLVLTPDRRYGISGSILPLA